MKKTTIILFLIISFSALLNAQNIFYYYFAPAATLDSAFGAANTHFVTLTDTSGNQVFGARGYHYVEVTAANRATFNAIASPHMKRTIDSMMDNNSSLRRKIVRILNLSNRVNPLTFWLVDDRTGLPDTVYIFTTDVMNGKIIAWPSTDNWRQLTVYVGRVRLGETAANYDVTYPPNPANGGWRRWESTVLHEATHTQFMLDTVNMNKWGPRGIEISYGGEPGHWFTELLADEQTALNEGFASFWGLEHHPPMAGEIVTFLNDTSARFLLGSHSFLSGIARMWNSPHAVEYSGPSTNAQFKNGHRIRLRNTAGNYELARYKWLNVPGDFVLYNEMMSESYFYLYHQYAYANRDTATNKIIKAIMKIAKPNQRLCYPATAANDLANSMEADARRRPTDTTLVSSMFAYALYDLLQHFGQTDSMLARDFRVQFATYVPDIPEPRAYAEYFNRRNAVKQLVCPFLSGNNACTPQNARVDVLRAVQALRDYFHSPAMILR